MGADQMYAGINNILTGQKSRSLFEEAGYNLTLRMGFSESTAGVVGQLTPGLLSLGAGIWGGMATSAARMSGRVVVSGGEAGQFGMIGGRISGRLSTQPRGFIQSPMRYAGLEVVADVRTSAMTNIRGYRRGLVARFDYVQGLEDTFRLITRTQDGIPVAIRFQRFQRGSGNMTARHRITQLRQTTGMQAGRVSRDEVIVFLPNDATMYEVLHEAFHVRHHLEGSRVFLGLTEEAREFEVYLRMRQSPYWGYFSIEEQLDAFRQAARFNPNNSFPQP